MSYASTATASRMCHAWPVMGRGRLRAALLVAVVASVVVGGMALGPTPQASAATGITLEGNGYGHGHGMSQYGARYRAEDGHTYSQILAAYYPGTTLATASDSDRIRVRIDSDTDNVTKVRAEPGLRIRTSLGSATLPSTLGGTTPSQWRIRIVSGSLRVEGLANGWHSAGTAVSELLIGRNYAEFVGTDGTVRLILDGFDREYVGVVRGIRQNATSTTLRTVVVSTYSDYLPSVVASEMPTSWPAHAVRAQAVAARTYAMFDLASKSGSTFDTCDSTACQVFSGRADYTSSGTLIRTYGDAAARDAVSATAGKYLRYDGGPAFTQFSASNGGYSVAGSRPYLKAAPDPYDRYPSWSTTISAATLQRAYPSIGRFSSVAVTRDGRGAYGGRAVTVTISGSSGSVSVTGNQFRSAFGLRSTLFRVAVTGAEGTVRDVNRDGYPDLVSITPAGRAELRYGTSSGTFGSPTMLGGQWNGKRQVTTIDSTVTPGTVDILAVEGASSDLAAYPIRQSGTLGSRRVVHTGDWSQYDLFLGVTDFAAPGATGLLARGRTTQTLYYFPYTSAGKLGSRFTVATGWSGIRLAAGVGDWNGDGHPDVIALDSSSRLWLYPGTGARSFGSRVLLSAASGWGGRTSLVGGADWDGNGTLDLVSATTGNTLMLNERTGAATIGSGRRLASSWVNLVLS